MAVVVLCFLAGVVLARAVPRSRALTLHLHRAVLSVALPALILLKVPDLPLGAAAVVPVAVAWSGMAIAAGTVLLVSRLAGWDRRTTGALLLVTPIANTAFVGFAAVEALLGEDHLAPAIAYDQLGSFLALVTFGSFVAGRYGATAEVPVSVVRRLFGFPPFVALLVSVPLRWVELPDVATDGLGLLAELVGPLALLALGLRFRLRIERAVLAPALTCLAVRMVLVPAVMLVAFAVAGGGTAWEASVLQSGMPSGVTAGLVAAAAGLEDRVATFVVGVGMLASFVSLPGIAFLVT